MGSLSQNRMKAQASVEMMVTFALVITFMVPVLLLLLVASQYGAESASISQGQASSHLVADTINDVFTQGPGASKIILVNLPGNTQKFAISGKEVTITMKVGNGNYEAVSPVFGNVGNFEIEAINGLFPLRIKNKGGVIEVAENE